MAITLGVDKDGRQIKGYFLDGKGIKDIPFSSVSSEDLTRWFGDKASSTAEARQLYGRVVALFRCVELRAQALAGLPRQIVDAESGQVVAVGQFPQAYRLDEDGNPLPRESELPFKINLTDLLWRKEAALSLIGAGYSLKERNRVRLVEVRWLDPSTITPQYSKWRGLEYFKREVSGIGPRRIPIEDMVWVWRPTLKECGFGVAPGQAAARKAGIADNMDEFIELFFEQGAMPTTVVFSKSNPPEKERERIKNYLERIMTGVRRAFGLEVLSAALEFKTLQPPLREMVIPDIEDSAQRGVVLAMGVPFSVVFSDASTFATAQVDDLHFYTKTILPEADLVEAQLNERLFEPLGLRLEFRPDLLEIFQAQEADKTDSAVLLFDRGAIDEDELRAAAGYGPRKGAEEQGGGGAEETGEETDLDEVDMEEERKGLVLGELGQWERKVLKRWPKVRPYTVPFEPEVLNVFEVATVRRALLRANTREEVKAAFAAPFCSPSVHQWNGRSRAKIPQY